MSIVESAAETIFALSSGAGMAGIAVIRVSGPRAGQAVAAICGQRPRARRAVLRTLRDPVTRETVDRGLVLWMPGPDSFTGEDVGEFHLHGSRAVVAAMLEALAKLDGLRLAQAGEFTRRAFDHGRLDLLEVEGLADLIAAQTEAQRRQALYHQSGPATGRVERWRRSVIEVLAPLEAAIDFVDEAQVERQALEGLRPRLQGLIEQFAAALEDFRRGERLRQGLQVVIAGAPNVGKSSLLNRLAGREAAIVSPKPGTTRDIVEVQLALKGVPVLLRDTAGLRRTGDEVEKEGVRRTVNAAAEADIVVVLTSADAACEDAEFGVAAGQRLAVTNKIDLAPAATGTYGVSARTGEGVDALVAALEDRVEALTGTQEPALVSRARHRECLERALHHLRAAQDLRDAPLELIAEEVRCAARELARIAGRVDVEDVLDYVFREFCIGK